MTAFRQRLRGSPPREDQSRVGITFIDVLFALVVGRILEGFGQPRRVPTIGVMHLGVAAALSITSWIGYHNSWNRPRYFIQFVNLPLLQFAVDVALVAVYWFTAVTAEGTGSWLADGRSSLPEAQLVAASGALYVAWDLIALRMRRAEKYIHLRIDKDAPQRRLVSAAFLGVAVVVIMVIHFWKVNSAAGIIGVDGTLIGLILLYRLAKEWVTPLRAQ